MRHRLQGEHPFAVVLSLREKPEEDGLESRVAVEAVSRVLFGRGSEERDHGRDEKGCHGARGEGVEHGVQLGEEVAAVQVGQAVRCIGQLGDELQGVELDENVFLALHLDQKIGEELELGDAEKAINIFFDNSDKIKSKDGLT